MIVIDLNELARPKFELGRTLMTPSIKYLIENEGLDPVEFLRRHHAGDWGDLTPGDIRANNTALRHGERILSSYNLDEAFSESRIWILTEADRSHTTVLLPHEY
jgi:hypothetical protein